MAAIDLSTLKNKSQDKDIIDFDPESLTPEQQEALDKMAEQHPEAAAEKVTTAFLIICKDGEWLVSPDISTPLAVTRQATPDDVYDGCSKTVRNIDIADTAQAVVGFQQQLAMQMHQQQQAARIAQGLKL